MKAERRVHILRHGAALCGQAGVPAEWPENHRWVSVGQHENPGPRGRPGCMCAECETALAGEVSDEVPSV